MHIYDVVGEVDTDGIVEIFGGRRVDGESVQVIKDSKRLGVKGVMSMEAGWL
jgi:hypothetical protein